MGAGVFNQQHQGQLKAANVANARCFHRQRHEAPGTALKIEWRRSRLGPTDSSISPPLLRLAE